MHILWLVKTVLPQAAAACGLAGASDVSGSWLTGQLAALHPHGELRLTVACTDARQKASLQGEQDGVSYRILPGADGFAALLQTEQPDLVHIWGTEYPEAAAMQDAAAALRYSDAYFCKLFKQCFKVNFSAYLNEYRVNKARQLILDPRLSLKDIGAAVGYSDANYFTRVFKRLTGQTPSEYRMAAAEKAVQG